LSQLLSKVTVTSSCFYIKCSVCPPCCLTMQCVVTEVVLFSIVAFRTLRLRQRSVATLLRCDRIFSDSIIINFLLILTIFDKNTSTFWATMYIKLANKDKGNWYNCCVASKQDPNRHKNHTVAIPHYVVVTIFDVWRREGARRSGLARSCGI